MGYFARECRAPRSQDRGRRENYKQGSKEEELAPKALMAIDEVGRDWSYMANEEENHALVADEEALTKFALMAKSRSSSKNEVEARLVKFKTQEIKFCEKIRGLEFDVESKNNKNEYLMNELKQIKKEKDGLDRKLTGFESASKDLDTLLGSQRSDKNKEGLGYSVGNSQNNIDDKGYWDSGCSRHMTGNISYLSDYEPYDGGYTIMATSTTEAKYVAAASGCEQVLWIQNQMMDYGHHFIRDCYEKKLINVDHIHTNDNVADLLTKPFDVGRLSKPLEALSKGITSSILLFRNLSSLAVEKYSGSGNFFTGSGNDLSILFPIWYLKDSLIALTAFADADHASCQDTRYSTSGSLQQTEMASKINAQDLEISSLKARIKLLEDKDKGSAELSGYDASIKGRSIEIEEEAGVEKSTERGSNDTEELVNVLTYIDAANILTSGVVDVSVPPVAGVSTVGVPTASGLFPTVSAVFTTISVVTPYSRRPREISAKEKGKEKMVESDTPKKKKLQEQIDIQLLETTSGIRATRIAQSKALSPAADKPASLLRDDSQREAFPTVTSLDAGQDRENIIKTSVLPHESTPRVTSLNADKGTQDLEIYSLKARIKLLEDNDRGSAEPSGDDAPIKGRSIEIGEEVRVKRSTELRSNDTEEMVNVLTSMDAANILTSEVAAVSVPPVARILTVGVPTVSGLVPTVSAILTTASV
nr:hypothetical protein [Tanacetum cinerariifolium]